MPQPDNGPANADGGPPSSTAYRYTLNLKVSLHRHLPKSPFEGLCQMSLSKNYTYHATKLLEHIDKELTTELQNRKARTFGRRKFWDSRRYEIKEALEGEVESVRD